MQLASKMGFVAAQFEALHHDLWRRNAAHANRMARPLAERVRGIKGLRIAYLFQANGVFAQLPAAAIAPLQRERSFYVWDADASGRALDGRLEGEADVEGSANAVERIRKTYYALTWYLGFSSWR